MALNWTETRLGPGGLRDCAVRAWAYATGSDYEQTRRELQQLDDQCRRRPVDIQQTGTQLAAQQRFGRAHGWRWVECQRVDGSLPSFDAENLPEGRLVAITERHAVAVVDHTLMDEYDSRSNSGHLWGYFQEIQ